MIYNRLHVGNINVDPVKLIDDWMIYAGEVDEAKELMQHYGFIGALSPHTLAKEAQETIEIIGSGMLYRFDLDLRRINRLIYHKTTTIMHYFNKYIACSQKTEEYV